MVVDYNVIWWTHDIHTHTRHARTTVCTHGHTLKTEAHAEPRRLLPTRTIMLFLTESILKSDIERQSSSTAQTPPPPTPPHTHTSKSHSRCQGPPVAEHQLRSMCLTPAVVCLFFESKYLYLKVFIFAFMIKFSWPFALEHPKSKGVQCHLVIRWSPWILLSLANGAKL